MSIIWQYIYDTYHIREHLIRGSQGEVRNRLMDYADIERETYESIDHLAQAYLNEIRLACEEVDDSGIRSLNGAAEAVD